MDPGEYGWESTPVSYSTVAEGLGIETMRAETADDVAETVVGAIESDGATLVEIPTDPYEPQSSVLMNE